LWRAYFSQGGPGKRAKACKYLATKSPGSHSDAKAVIGKLSSILSARKSHPVDVEGLRILESNEKSHWGEDCIGEFKFTNNKEMLGLIERGNA
jgi:hypothetical protein